MNIYTYRIEKMHYQKLRKRARAKQSIESIQRDDIVGLKIWSCIVLLTITCFTLLKIWNLNIDMEKGMRLLE
jgi:hypothetical protein